MTKQQLQQLHSLIGEIEDAQRRAYERAAWSLFAEDEQERRAWEENVRQLAAWIGEIPDSLVRRAIKLRYVDGLPWLMVAARMGYRSEGAPRNICERYLQSADDPPGA